MDLEQGKEGIGQKILFAIAHVLPGWDEDTPRAILEGNDPPPLAQDRPAEVPAEIMLTAELPGELPDYSHLSPDERRRIIRRSIDQMPFALDLGQDVYDVLRERLISLIVKYEPREGE